MQQIITDLPDRIGGKDLTPEDHAAISQAIAHYKATGTILSPPNAASKKKTAKKKK